MPVLDALIEGLVSYLFAPLFDWIVWPILKTGAWIAGQTINVVRFVRQLVTRR